MESIEVASIALSVSSTIAIAIAGGIIKYALNTNERLTRLETCIKAIKDDIEEIKKWYDRLDSDVEDTAKQLARMEERIRLRIEEKLKKKGW